MKLRQRLKLSDIKRLCDLSEDYERGNFITRLYVLSQMVGILYETRFPVLHISSKKIEAALKAHDMLGRATRGGNRSMLPVTSYLGARLGKTPEEIESSVTMDEVHALYVEILRKDIETKYALVQAYHDPKSVVSDIKKSQRKLRHKNKSKPRYINGDYDGSTGQKQISGSVEVASKPAPKRSQNIMANPNSADL